MEYEISSESWFKSTPQTGDFTSGTAKKTFLLGAISLTGGLCLSVLAYKHTGYGIPISALDSTYDQIPEIDPGILNHSFDVKATTDRIKRVLGLSISRQSQVFGVSRQSVYNWINGEEPTGKNLAILTDLNSTAELFETEGVKVTGLLMKRPFAQGKSLQDLMVEGIHIYQYSKDLVAQLKREAEEKKKLSLRFRNRERPNIAYGME